MAKYRNLENLWLNSTTVTNLDSLSGCTRLKELYLGSAQVPPEDINRLVQKIPGLKIIR